MANDRGNPSKLGSVFLLAWIVPSPLILSSWEEDYSLLGTWICYFLLEDFKCFAQFSYRLRLGEFFFSYFFAFWRLQHHIFVFIFTLLFYTFVVCFFRRMLFFKQLKRR